MEQSVVAGKPAQGRYEILHSSILKSPLRDDVVLGDLLLRHC